jgi:hypothetical protein
MKCRGAQSAPQVVGIARKKQLGGKIELALTSDNPNPYLRAWVRNLAFKPVGVA